MLDVIFKLAIAFGAGSVVYKLSSERVASNLDGLECRVVVPRQNIGDWFQGSSGIWHKSDRVFVAEFLANNDEVIKFAQSHGCKRIKIHPPVSDKAGQVRVPPKVCDGDFNVFIFSTPKESVAVKIPKLAGLAANRALLPTGEVFRSTVFGHPSVQFESALNSAYFLGFIPQYVDERQVQKLLQVFQGDDGEPDNNLLSLEAVRLEDLYRDHVDALWTEELKACIVSEAKKVRDVVRVEFQDCWKFSVFTEVIVYKYHKLGEFRIDYKLERGGYCVTWHNLTYGPGTQTEYGSVVGNAPFVDESGRSRLYLAMVDIPKALAAYRIEEAVRSSIRVLKSSSDTQAFYAAIECYPPVS